MPLSKQKKGEYFKKMTNYLNTYSKVFVVEVDNVGSQQMNQTRRIMRGQAEVLMVRKILFPPLCCYYP